MSHTVHREQAADLPVHCAVITVSDTRTEATDRSGALIQACLAMHGFETTVYRIVPDEPEMITRLLDELAGQVDAVLLNGGTGISARDTTYEAIAGRLEKTLPGFGELFRMLSFEEIGSAAMLSRAVGGVYRGTLLFSIPGSSGAVRLAMERLILPELRHLVWELLRQQA